MLTTYWTHLLFQPCPIGGKVINFVLCSFLPVRSLLSLLFPHSRDFHFPASEHHATDHWHTTLPRPPFFGHAPKLWNDLLLEMAAINSVTT